MPPLALVIILDDTCDNLHFVCLPKSCPAVRYSILWYRLSLLTLHHRTVMHVCVDIRIGEIQIAHACLRQCAAMGTSSAFGMYGFYSAMISLFSTNKERLLNVAMNTVSREGGFRRTFRREAPSDGGTPILQGSLESLYLSRIIDGAA